MGKLHQSYKLVVEYRLTASRQRTIIQRHLECVVRSHDRVQVSVATAGAGCFPLAQSLPALTKARNLPKRSVGVITRHPRPCVTRHDMTWHDLTWARTFIVSVPGVSFILSVACSSFKSSQPVQYAARQNEGPFQENTSPVSRLIYLQSEHSRSEPPLPAQAACSLQSTLARSLIASLASPSNLVISAAPPSASRLLTR